MATWHRLSCGCVVYLAAAIMSERFNTGTFCMGNCTGLRCQSKFYQETVHLARRSLAS